MRLGVEHGIAGTVSVLVAAVIVAVAGVAEVAPSAPFPYGTQAPSGCSTYGTEVLQNGSYWFCELGNATTIGFSPGKTSLTFADVLFRVLEYSFSGSTGHCETIPINGTELDRASSLIVVTATGPFYCGFPSPIAFAADGVFGAQLPSAGALVLLVRVSPN